MVQNSSEETPKELMQEQAVFGLITDQFSVVETEKGESNNKIAVTYGVELISYSQTNSLNVSFHFIQII